MPATLAHDGVQPPLRVQVRQGVVYSLGIRRRVGLADGGHSGLGAEREGAVPVALLDVAVRIESELHIGVRRRPASDERHVAPLALLV